MTEILDFDSALAALEPATCGVYVYCNGADVPPEVTPFAIINESEGPCALIPAEDAKRHNISYSHEPLTRISLGVSSAVYLHGLTGAVAQNLAAAQIPCNVISGMRHDHLFVTKRHSREAMSHLRRLAKQAQGWARG
ncbi:MAG: hypothetical protein Q4B10_03760 [Actinomycetaceae bacterium]|nr:hypothetical protein [Actinomycetaceae bacterium]